MLSETKDRAVMAKGLCDGLMQIAIGPEPQSWNGVVIAMIDALSHYLDYVIDKLDDQESRALDITKGTVIDLGSRKAAARIAFLVDCAEDVEEAHNDFEYRWRETIGLVRALVAIDPSPDSASIKTRVYEDYEHFCDKLQELANKSDKHFAKEEAAAA